MEHELDEFSDADFERLVHFLDEVRARKRDHHWFQVFGRYEGIPLYKAEFRGRVAVFAVEDTGDEHVRVTVMFAGHRAPLPDGSNQAAVWDGTDDRELLRGVVFPRCRLLFRPS